MHKPTCSWCNFSFSTQFRSSLSQLRSSLSQLRSSLSLLCSSLSLLCSSLSLLRSSLSLLRSSLSLLRSSLSLLRSSLSLLCSSLSQLRSSLLFSSLSLLWGRFDFRVQRSVQGWFFIFFLLGIPFFTHRMVYPHLELLLQRHHVFTVSLKFFNYFFIIGLARCARAINRPVKIKRS